MTYFQRVPACKAIYKLERQILFQGAIVPDFKQSVLRSLAGVTICLFCVQFGFHKAYAQTQPQPQPAAQASAAGDVAALPIRDRAHADQARLWVRDQRAQNEAEESAAKAQCYKLYFVNDCLAKIKVGHDQRRRSLKNLEVAANAFVRNDEANKRNQQNAQRQAQLKADEPRKTSQQQAMAKHDAEHQASAKQKQLNRPKEAEKAAEKGNKRRQTDAQHLAQKNAKQNDPIAAQTRADKAKQVAENEAKAKRHALDQTKKKQDNQTRRVDHAKEREETRRKALEQRQKLEKEKAMPFGS